MSIIRTNKHHLDLLGDGVEIANRRIHQDEHIKGPLKELGKKLGRIIPDGNFEYCGSIASHIYKNEFGKELRFVHHHAFDIQVSEGLISTCCADQAVHLMEDLFGRSKPSTLNKKDQRGKKDL